MLHIKIGKIDTAEIQKAIVAGTAALGLLATTVFTSGTVNHDLTVGIGIASAIGVFLAKNAPAKIDPTDVAEDVTLGEGLVKTVEGNLGTSAAPPAPVAASDPAVTPPPTTT